MFLVAADKPFRFGLEYPVVLGTSCFGLGYCTLLFWVRVLYPLVLG